MARALQLASLSIFILSCVHTGAAQCDGGEISEAVLEAMQPFMREMRRRLDTVKNELSRIEDKVEGMNEELQQDKNQTSTELNGIKATFNKSIISLSEHIESQLASVDARVTEEHREMESQLKNNLAEDLDKINLKLDLLDINQDRLDAKVTLVNTEVENNILTNITEGLKTYSLGSTTPHVLAINATLSKEFGQIEYLIEKHTDETTAQIAELDIPSHKQLTETLLSVNSSLTGHVSCIKEELNSLNDSINMIINDFENFTAEEECISYTCGGEGGWRRVVYLNMTDPNSNCPPGWQLTSHQNRSCGRLTKFTLSCDSAFFPVTGSSYNKVCGRIRGYQEGPVDAFESYDDGIATTIDSAYVSGVSLTYGSPRQHIWTFAAGNDETQPSGDFNCPCDATININVPPFVGQDYFCESGANFGSSSGFHPNDILWDGEDCSSSSSCCSFNNPPYFTRQLSSLTTDDIEARICHDWENVEDTPIEFIELYVKGPNDDGTQCINKEDAVSAKIDSVSATLREEHQETRDELEEHKNHVNSELVELQMNQDNIDLKLDSLESKQEQLSQQVLSVSSQLAETRDMVIDSLLSVCLGSGELPNFTTPDAGYTCGGEGGWRRVVYLDMTDPTSSCPSGWQFISSPRTLCNMISSTSHTCDSVFFPVTGGPYSRVCGRIVGYQHDSTDAFEAYHVGQATTIDEAYVSGISLTHGTPRQHIWTFASGRSENRPSTLDVCPCDASISINVPPFVGEDYFCESGANLGSDGAFLLDDPLWDGMNCISSSRCCSLNNPPYFIKQLDVFTSDDIEARMCQQDGGNEDTPIEFIELYVK